MKFNNQITPKRAREVLSYDQDTGIFRWKKTLNNRGPAGALAGYVSCGYLSIRIDTVSYRAHRLAWLIVYGRWPDGEIDHINQIKLDNRLSNLRDCSSGINKRNKPVQSNNKLGLKGVSRDGKKFRATIHHNKKQMYLGSYPSPEEANRVFLEAENRLYGGIRSR